MPWRVGLRNLPGGIGGRHSAYPAMRPHMVVVVTPCPQYRSGMAEGREQRLVHTLVAQATGFEPSIRKRGREAALRGAVAIV